MNTTTANTIEISNQEPYESLTTTFFGARFTVTMPNEKNPEGLTFIVESLVVPYEELVMMTQAMKFKDYIYGIDTSLVYFVKIRVDKLTWFCAPNAKSPEKLGFIYGEETVFDKRNNKPVPGVVFARGNSVVIYIEVDVFEETELGNRRIVETFVPFTKQIRMGTGQMEIELPAGMCDANGDVCGVAIKEIKEETGLILPNASHMTMLGMKENQKPSIGGTYEKQTFFYCKLSVDIQQYAEMKHKVYGCEHENETIQLELVPTREVDDFIRTTGDMKAMTARYLMLTSSNSK